MQGSMFLRQSNVKLQEELKKTNSSYAEEKTMLRSQLSCLRLDLGELHNDNLTITTDETPSRMDASSLSQTERRRLADFDADTGRSLQLPTIKNLNLASGRKDTNKDTARSKALRFNGHDETDATDSQRNASAFGMNGNDYKQESQKFLELQKNQEFLRSIGRANLKEKRQSLIRLPTISSAKKRNSLWDSGNNVSRPKGKSTSFEQNPYVEDSIVMSKRAFKIPSIKDTHRSEIHLADMTKRPSLTKRKVKFTRPREEDGLKGKDHHHPHHHNPLDVSVTESSSLNTTLADVSLEDNTLGNITFDEDTFNKQLAAKHDQTSSTTHKSQPNNKRHNQSIMSTTFSSLQPIAEKEQTTVSDSTTVNAKPCQDKNDKSDNDDQDVDNSNPNNDSKTNDQLTLPPLKIKTLAKKNLMIHDMNMRTTPTTFPKLRLSPDSKSGKDSDRSVGSKFSRLSQETESWKSTYVTFTDPERRNKTLTEIMFAVRSRMRDNEETLRFGEAPRPKDKTLSDILLSRNRSVTTPKWSDATQSPRKGKISKRGRPTIPPTKAEKSTRRTDSTAHLQGYLRKMCRQKRVTDQQQQDYSPRQSRPAVQIHKQQQPMLIAQQA